MRRIPAALLASALLLLGALPALARERVRDLSVRVDQGEIKVSARLTGGFPRSIEKDIFKGIEKDYYYYLVLKKKQRGWFDEEVTEKTLRYTVRYDPAKGQFTVRRSIGAAATEEIVRDFEQVKNLLSTVNDVTISATEHLKRKRRYSVSVKVQMRATKVPLHLDDLLFFFPFLELNTPWAQAPVPPW